MQSTIATVADLSAANPEGFINGKKTIFRGLSADRLRLFHSRAVMLKSSVPKPYLRAGVKLPLSSVELFFDVEVDPLRDICYLHGIVERREGVNESERFIAFFAPEVSAPYGIQRK